MTTGTGDVTVVIPTHGRPGMLAEAIRSAIEQEYAPAEIIVVDDLADEATEAVVRHIAETTEAGATKLVYVPSITPPHELSGASRSRNIGLARATSFWISFLDDDDLWKPNFLSRCMGLLGAQSCGMAVAWTELTRNGRAVPGGHTYSPQTTVENALRRNPGVTGSNFVINRTVAAEIDGFDEALRVANDRDFIIRVLDYGVEISVVQERLIVQRGHDAGQLTTRSESRAAGLELFAMKHRGRLRHSDRRELKRLVHSIRRKTKRSRRGRLYHLAAQIMCTSPSSAVSSVKSLIAGRDGQVYD